MLLLYLIIFFSAVNNVYIIIVMSGYEKVQKKNEFKKSENEKNLENISQIIDDHKVIKNDNMGSNTTDKLRK